MRRTLLLAIACTTAAFAGCSRPRKPVAETATGEVSVARPPAAARAISFFQISGRWSIRATPEIGDTAATAFVLAATSSAQGWTITFPARDPIPARVLLIAGDSVVVEAGPFASDRRPGLQTTTRDVYHLTGDELVGMGVWHSATSTPDSILRMRLIGTHAP